LQLELIGNQRNKFRVRGFTLCIADGVPKEALQGIQITPIPCHLDGVADGTLYPAGRC